MLIHEVIGLLNPLLAAGNAEVAKEGLRSVALGVGAAGGAAGAGAGIGGVFNASIQAKTRQPELTAEVERDQWLGFALTEACFFYGLVGGFIAFFL
jgi:F-type H+-transporting ATPase subunit c